MTCEFILPVVLFSECIENSEGDLFWTLIHLNALLIGNIYEVPSMS